MIVMPAAVMTCFRFSPLPLSPRHCHAAIAPRFDADAALLLITPCHHAMPPCCAILLPLRYAFAAADCCHAFFIFRRRFLYAYASALPPCAALLLRYAAVKMAIAAAPLCCYVALSATRDFA